jgi:hypothetical protein
MEVYFFMTSMTNSVIAAVSIDPGQGLIKHGANAASGTKIVFKQFKQKACLQEGLA